MSTLQLSNIRDTSGNNNSTPEQIGKGRIKAWVSFSGDDADISAGMTAFNVSTLTDHGDGDYSINFTNNMTNANYGFVGTAGRTDGSSSAIFNVEPRANSGDERATNTFRFEVVYVTSTANRTNWNPAIIYVCVFGD